MHAQSVIKKMEELKAVVNVKQPDVIALTETWTNSDISDEYLCLNGYELMARKDREDTDRGRGGGILIYVAKEICAWKVEVPGFFEQRALVKLRTKKGDLGIYVIYRSPNSSSNNDASLCELVREMRESDVLIGEGFVGQGFVGELGEPMRKAVPSTKRWKTTFLLNTSTNQLTLAEMFSTL